MEVLNIFADNTPALYIIAYYEEFVVKNDSAMNNQKYKEKFITSYRKKQAESLTVAKMEV